LKGVKGMDWKLKLKAILHDPPYKIKFIESHRRKAEELFKKILPNETFEDDKVILADQIASAQSRIIVQPKFEDKQKEKDFQDKSRVNFDECEFIDIFSENKEPVQSPDVEKVLKLFGDLGTLDISKNINNEYERAELIFLFLWRFYPEIFPEINKHPADSRAPNHSIYDHLVQTSAIVSALRRPAFLLFTIAPVQSFISKARKTSDLWAGSYMLSYLTWESMKPLVENFGPDIVVFPNLYGQPLVDRWLYFKFSNNSSFIKLNYQKIKDWFKKWENKNKDLEEELTIANFPNRFLAIIPYDNTLAIECEEAFKGNLKDLAEKVYEKIKSYTEKVNPNTKNYIEKHLLTYFQVYWVIIPWSNSPIPNPPLRRDFPSEKDYENACEKYKEKYVLPVLKDYEALFKEDDLHNTIKVIIDHPYYKPANVGSAYSLLLELLEKLLGARKSVRDFYQLEQPDEKCHLCGEFEVLNVDWEKLYPKYVKQDEKLCGVCLTKRFFPEIIKDEFGLSEDAVKFPSTSEMASIGEKRRLNDEIKKIFGQEFNKFREIIKKKNNNKELPSSISVPRLKKIESDPLREIDGEFLMEENYTEDHFVRNYGLIVSKEDFQNVLNILKLNQINPSRYYAILQMDGDHIGKWLRGEFNPKIKDTIHNKVVDVLISYSEGENRRNIERILCAKHPTSPSIHQTFSRRLSNFAINEVRKIVEEEHYGKLVYAGGDDVLALLSIEEVLKCAYNLQKKYKEILSPKATMSAGILIVHHKYPLYLALKKVQEAEKKMKNIYNRNGFCLVYMSNSGEERECGGNWELVGFIEDLICNFKIDKISTTFPYQFLQVVESLYETEKDKNLENIKEILKKELERIFLRKKGEKSELKEILEKSISPWFEKIEDVYNFANILVIAKKIADEVRI
jgi:CRISPR-associated protein Cmr2